MTGLVVNPPDGPDRVGFGGNTLSGTGDASEGDVWVELHRDHPDGENVLGVFDTPPADPPANTGWTGTFDAATVLVRGDGGAV